MLHQRCGSQRKNRFQLQCVQKWVGGGFAWLLTCIFDPAALRWGFIQCISVVSTTFLPKYAKYAKECRLNVTAELFYRLHRTA